jgi:hypothetical protein
MALLILNKVDPAESSRASMISLESVRVPNALPPTLLVAGSSHDPLL